MTVLYRGPHGWVTHDVIATGDTAWRRIPIAELSGVHIVRCRSGNATSVHRAFAGSTLLMALVIMPVGGWPAAVLAVALAVAAMIAVVARQIRQHDRWELTARHRGAPILLFGSTDQREFDQVCRAVQRALEHHQDG